MNLKALLTIGIFVAGLVFVSYAESDAARFGRGKSFGSKPAMQKSMPAQSVQDKAPVAGAAGAGAAGAGAAGAGAAGAAAKPGLMGGLFGGLLAGTLIGSLLAGGLGGMGGSILNILFFGILAFVAYKLYQRFRANKSESTATASGPDVGSMQMPPQQSQTMARQQTGMDWGNLQDKPDRAASALPQISMPEGFDSEEFLRGAKMAYSRLQSAWDKRDISDLAQFVNPSVLKEIQKQLHEDPTPSTTDVLLINARLLEVKDDRTEQTALVYFDVLLREDPAQTSPTQVKEVWHFSRPAASEGSWKLDGIQQVD